jgi:carotenoid cleavage dioxygenase-like enzyme
MLEFDPLSLETIGRKSYKNSIASFGGIELFSTAHPHLQFENNEFFTYNYFLEFRPIKLPGFPASNIAHIAKTDKSGFRKVIGSVQLEPGIIPYVHDFSVTENYALLCVYPLNVSPVDMISSDAGFLKELVWKDEILVDKDGEIVSKPASTKIYVFDKYSESIDPIATFEAPPIFAYHHVNAYEEKSKTDSKDVFNIVMDITGYNNAKIVNGEHGFALISNMKEPSLRQKQVKQN